MEKRKDFNPLERNLFHFSEFRDGFKAFSNNKHKQISFLTGFTLIELLVVIAIITVLLAILVPALRNVRNQARSVICQSHLKQWSTIFALYTDENEGRLFNISTYHSFMYNSYKNDNEDKFFIKNKNTGFRTREIMFCPMASSTGSKPFPENLFRGLEGSRYEHDFMSQEGTIGSAFEAWKVTDFINGYKGSYGYNCAFFSGSYWISELYKRGFKWKGLNVYNVNGQFNIPVFLDCASPDSPFVWEGQLPAPTEEEETGPCINRHNEHVNSLFLDWSVRKVGLKELWILKWHKDFDTNGPWTKAGGVQPQDWPQWMRGFKDY